MVSGAVLFGKRGHPSNYGIESSDIIFNRFWTLESYARRRLAPRQWDPFLNHWEQRQFARWAARAMPECDIVHAWSQWAYEPFMAAKKYGRLCVLDRSAAHQQYWTDVLSEECRRWGETYRYSQALTDNTRREYDLADAIIVPSTFCKNNHIQYGVPKQKIHLAPFGMQTVALGPRRTPSSVFRVLVVGSIRVLKGIPYVLQAAELLKDIPDIEFGLVGGKPDPSMIPLIEKCKGRVKYMGFFKKQDLFNQVYPAGSVLLQPSLMEGLSYVILEALSHGLPVVATPNTGAEDIMQDGKHGFIVPTRNPQAIADAIRKLYENHAQYDEMSEQAYQLRFAKGRTWQDYGRQVMEIYNTLLKHPGSPTTE